MANCDFHLDIYDCILYESAGRTIRVDSDSTDSDPGTLPRRLPNVRILGVRAYQAHIVWPDLVGRGSSRLFSLHGPYCAR